LKRHLVKRLRESPGWSAGAIGRVDRPDLLHAASIERDEVIHTRILGWLLDPPKTGALGRKLLIELVSRAYSLRRHAVGRLLRGDARVIIESGGDEGRPDLEVRGGQYLVVVENKVDAGQHSRQLAGYRKRAFRTARSLGVARRRVFLVYLTLSREDVSWRGTGFAHLTYVDLAKGLERALNVVSKGDRTTSAAASQYLTAVRKLSMGQEGLSQVARRVQIRSDGVASLSLDSLKRLSDWVSR
jgi:hypothetical protein